MTSKRSLRAPFVVTFAAAAVLPACGGTLVRPDVDASADAPPSVDTSNPPPPDAAVRCPEAVPASGTTCDPAIFAEGCNYPTAGPPCNGPTPLYVRCSTNSRTWEHLAQTCNPPPVQCPTTPPAAGASCPPNAIGLCNWTVPCGSGTARVDAMCRSGVWTVTQTPSDCNAPRCPTAPPSGACDPRWNTEECRYSRDCFGSPNPLIARCDTSTGQWQRIEATCNPPPPTPCPMTPPPTGTPCFPSPVMNTCRYPNTCPTGEVTAVCDPMARAWRRQVPDGCVVPERDAGGPDV